jgi:colanic acid/amylovoran biosynthesis glycosyltransferase
MRIIYITSSMPYGAVETFVISEVEEVRKQGHDVLIVPMHPRGPVLHTDTKPLLEYVSSQPLLSPRIAKWAAEVFVRAPIRTFRALSWLLRSRSAKVLLKNLAVYPKGLWLARLAREWRADHIHAHWAATTATMALVASEFSGIPWSCTAHAWDITDWQSGSAQGRGNNALLSLKISRACFVRFISRVGRKEAGLPSIGDSTDTKSLVLHMGVELPDLTGIRRLNGRGRHPIILCPAAFIPFKGHRYLIEAVYILLKRGVDFELWLAGAGELEDELRKQVEALEPAGNVRFLGQLAHPEVIEFYRRREVDIVVLPSLDLGGSEHEGIPVSLMEAMSYGVPVVSTITGGIPELLGGGAGVMVPPADPKTLAEAIGRLIQDPELRERQGDAGRERVEESYSNKEIVGELIARFQACAPARSN